MEDGKASPETCRQDSAERLALAQSELFLAKVEHRRKAGDEMKRRSSISPRCATSFAVISRCEPTSVVASESKSSSERSLRSMTIRIPRGFSGSSAPQQRVIATGNEIRSGSRRESTLLTNRCAADGDRHCVAFARSSGPEKLVQKNRRSSGAKSSDVDQAPKGGTLQVCPVMATAWWRPWRRKFFCPTGPLLPWLSSLATWLSLTVASTLGARLVSALRTFPKPSPRTTGRASSIGTSESTLISTAPWPLTFQAIGRATLPMSGANMLTPSPHSFAQRSHTSMTWEGDGADRIRGFFPDEL